MIEHNSVTDILCEQLRSDFGSYIIMNQIPSTIFFSLCSILFKLFYATLDIVLTTFQKFITK